MESVTKKTRYVNPPLRKGNCGKWTMVLEKTDHSIDLTRLYCQSWNCPICREVKIGRLVQDLKALVIVSYIEIHVPLSVLALRPVLDKVLKTLKRKCPELEYLMAVRASEDGCDLGLFQSQRSFHPKTIREIWRTYGVEVEVEHETLYRENGSGDRIRELLQPWADDSSTFHRIRVTRGFWSNGSKAVKDTNVTRAWVSPLTIEALGDYFESLGCHVLRLSPDHFLVEGGSGSGVPPVFGGP